MVEVKPANVTAIHNENMPSQSPKHQPTMPEVWLQELQPHTAATKPLPHHHTAAPILISCPHTLSFNIRHRITRWYSSLDHWSRESAH
ncbi:hypothetical protein E2C01_002722 [Portunus trituberculatus]|uniref:Uncharacterized protein n=1 Tax=Portunus trituberculatus TaxID=210409 RepID=A0A5B7CLH6_PORTR|nr:hypothetical protein [Portunus trituberculatus]